MGAVVLDANVLVGFLDPDDALHGRAGSVLAPLLGSAEDLLMPSTAYGETIVHPLRRGVAERVDDLIEEAGITIVAVDRALARQAAQVRAEEASLRLGDAVVLATALQHKARLLSFDERLLRIVERLEREQPRQ